MLEEKIRLPHENEERENAQRNNNEIRDKVQLQQVEEICLLTVKEKSNTPP